MCICVRITNLREQSVFEFRLNSLSPSKLTRRPPSESGFRVLRLEKLSWENAKQISRGARRRKKNKETPSRYPPLPVVRFAYTAELYIIVLKLCRCGTLPGNYEMMTCI